MKRPKRRISSILCLSLLLIPVSALSETPNQKPLTMGEKTFNINNLRGEWEFIHIKPDGSTLEVLAQLKQKGMIQLNFKDTDTQGQITKRVEIGEWGLAKDVHFVTIKAIGPNTENLGYTNLNDPGNYDVYKILKLNDKELHQQHLVSGAIYKLKKVK